MRLGTYYRYQILSRFKIEANTDMVLDVGGYDGFWLASQKAKNKYVLDLEVIKQYKTIHYIEGNALSIPFKENTFNQVFAFDVLEHIDSGKEQRFIDELMRVCKKDGSVIITTPSKDIRIFPPFMTAYVSKKWGHLKCNGYSKKELSTLLTGYKKSTFIIDTNNALFYRNFYLLLRISWILIPDITKRIINWISSKDYQSRKGIHGFYIVKITK